MTSAGSIDRSYRVAVDLGTSCARVLEDPLDRALPTKDVHAEEVCLQPVAYGPEGDFLVGAAARERLAESPASGATSYLTRIGDDIPVLVGGHPMAPEDLLALALRHQLAGTADRRGGEPSDIRVVVPAEWGPHRQGLVASALEALGLSPVYLVAAPVAALQAPGLDLPAEADRILVLDAGDGRTSAALVDRGGDHSWQLRRVAGVDFGGRDIDDALLGFVCSRLTGPTPDGHTLRQACRSARHELSLAPSVVLVPGEGAEPLRLVRAELDALVGERLCATFSTLLTRLGLHPGLDDDAAGAVDAVVLSGGLARMPLLVATVSQLLDRPVVVPEEPSQAAVLGAVSAAREGDPPRDRGVVEAAGHGVSQLQGTRHLPQVPWSPGHTAEVARPRRGFRQPRRHYGGFAAAAALVVVVGTSLALPGLSGGLAEWAGGDPTVTGAIAGSRGPDQPPATSEAAGERADATAEGERRGPLRALADLLTPPAAAAGPTDATTPDEQSGPLHALADRLGVATPSSRPTGPAVEAASTDPTSAPVSGRQPAGSGSTSGGVEATSVPGTTAASSEPTAPATSEAAPTTSQPPATQPPPSQAPETSTPTQPSEPAPTDPGPAPVTGEPAPQPSSDPVTPPPAPAPTSEPEASGPTSNPDPAPSASTAEVPPPAPAPEPAADPVTPSPSESFSAGVV